MVSVFQEQLLPLKQEFMTISAIFDFPYRQQLFSKSEYCTSIVLNIFVIQTFILLMAQRLQVNTLAAEKLYSLAGDWADLSPDTILFDICCGTGTIGLNLAHRVGMVTARFIFTLSIEPNSFAP